MAEDGGIVGQCRCGNVTVRLPHLPAKLNRCSCSICRRYGALWGYFARAEVTVSGATDSYAWGPKRVAFHRCARCGVLTHWQRLRGAGDRMGVNMQNVPPSLLAGLPEEDRNGS